MEVSVDESLAAMLSASLTISGLGPVIETPSKLLCCFPAARDTSTDWPTADSFPARSTGADGFLSQLN